MSKSKQLAINTLIVGLSKMSVALASFLVLPLYTKYLNAEEYGSVDLVLVYGALVVPIVTLRLELAIFRWLVDARGNDARISEIITNIVQIIVCSLILFSVLFWIIFNVFNIPYAGLIYSYILVAVLAGIVLQIARGLGRIGVFAIGGILIGVVSAIIGSILVSLYGMGVNGILFGLVFGNMIAIIYAATMLRIYKYFSGQKSMNLKNELIKFSVPMIPNGLSGWAIFAGSKVVISATLGVAANGIYAVAGRFTTLFSGIYEIFNITWTEAASLHIDAEDRDVFFTKVINTALIFFGSAAIGFVALLPIIFPFLVNPSFSEAYNYIPLLVVGFFLDTVVKMIGAIYVALRMTKQLMYTTITSAFISIVGTIILISEIGLWAPVVSSVAAFLIMAIYRYKDINKLGVDIKLKPLNMVMLFIAFSIVAYVYYLGNSNVILHLITLLFALVFAVSINLKTMIQFKSLLNRK
jgi:O-antigen/teichoic acid export membrane protein